MRTLTEKYNGVLKGTFSKDQFLKEARIQHPNLVTQHNNYQDAINILKNRSIISEIFDQNSSYEQAMEEAERVSTEEGVTQHVNDLGNDRYGVSDWYDSERTVATFERGIRIHETKRLSEAAYKDATNIELEQYLVNLNSELKAEKNSAKAELIKKDIEEVKQELQSRKGKVNEAGKSYKVSESKKALKETNELPHRIKASMGLDQSLLNFLKNIYSRASPEKIPADIKQKIADLEKAIVKWESELKVSQGGSELSEAGRSYKVSKDAIEVSQLKKGDVLKASGAEIVAISAGAKTPSGKMDVTVKYPNGKEETKQWGKTTKVVVKPKESIKESYEIPKPELSLNAVDKGIRFELNKKGLDTDCTVDEYVKAKKTATKNLEQDLLYYSREEGAKDMPVSKTDQMVKVKLKEGVKNLIRKVLAEGNTPKRTFTVKGKLK
jgi:hypothetical protein